MGFHKHQPVNNQVVDFNTSSPKATLCCAILAQHTTGEGATPDLFMVIKHANPTRDAVTNEINGFGYGDPICKILIGKVTSRAALEAKCWANEHLNPTKGKGLFRGTSVPPEYLGRHFAHVGVTDGNPPDSLNEMFHDPSNIPVFPAIGTNDLATRTVDAKKAKIFAGDTESDDL